SSHEEPRSLHTNIVPWTRIFSDNDFCPSGDLGSRTFLRSLLHFSHMVTPRPRRSRNSPCRQHFRSPRRYPCTARRSERLVESRGSGKRPPKGAGAVIDPSLVLQTGGGRTDLRDGADHDCPVAHYQGSRDEDRTVEPCVSRKNEVAVDDEDPLPHPTDHVEPARSVDEREIGAAGADGVEG